MRIFRRTFCLNRRKKKGNPYVSAEAQKTGWFKTPSAFDSVFKERDKVYQCICRIGNSLVVEHLSSMCKVMGSVPSKPLYLWFVCGVGAVFQDTSGSSKL